MSNPIGDRAELIAAYQTLDVEFQATERAIRHRYRELARQHHPDKWPNGSPQQNAAAGRMRQINAAYERVKSAPLHGYVPAEPVGRPPVSVFERPMTAATETLVRFALGGAFGVVIVVILHRRGVPGIAVYAWLIPLLVGFAFTSTSERLPDVLRLFMWWW